MNGSTFEIPKFKPAPPQQPCGYALGTCGTDPVTDAMTNSNLPERFWAKVNKTETCWLWTASLGTTGYGQVSVNGKPRKAHRVAYELMVGPIPDGLTIDHLCFNPKCVNPDHLEPVTNLENLRRAKVAGRVANNGHLQRAKTHCPKGHPYSGENLRVRVNRDGARRRSCRECENAARRKPAV